MVYSWRNSVDKRFSGQKAPSQGRSGSLVELSLVGAQLEPGENCVYNHMRGCFVGLYVVAGELSTLSLLDWISTLKTDSGTGIWITPFRGMPSKEMGTPVDLLYVDADSRVIEAVELFPTFQVSLHCAPAASVLVLPPGTISLTNTRAGDQLLLCPTEEIKWRLEELVGIGSVGQDADQQPAVPPLRPVLVRGDLQNGPGAVAACAVTGIAQALDTKAAEAALEWVADSLGSTETLVQQPAAPETAPELPQPPAKPWLTRLLLPSPLAKLGRWLMEPGDPRKVGRSEVEGLIAYFFTGGAPEAHQVREVSATGLYVVTAERWYPGTIIRMTLTKPDVGQAPDDRSITIQTRAVRWGNDGVGLEFLVDDPQASRQRQQILLGGVSGKQLKRFLKGIRNPGD